MPLVARHGALTDIGLHRKTNEDAYVVAPPLFAVCDGMGGAQAGEVASSLAAETLAAGVAAGRPLLQAAEEANAAVFARANADAAHTGMGTTLTALLLQDTVGHFVHIGDSRAYLLRAGELQQVSDDHSLVGEMIREGRLTEEEAAVHPHRSILSRALGTEPSVRIDEFVVDLLGGDVLLLCSDGLCGVVPAPVIARHMGRSDPQEAANRLIAEARRGGGPDNITAVVVRLETPDPDAGGEDEVTLAVPADEAATRIGPALVPPPLEGGETPAGSADEQEPGGLGGRPLVDFTLVVPAAAVSVPAAEGTPDDVPAVDPSEAETGRLPNLAAPAAAAGIAAAGPSEDALAASDALPDAAAAEPSPDRAAEPDDVPTPVPPAPDPGPPARRRRRRFLGWFAVLLAALVVLGSVGAFTLSTVYYVGVDDGRLAVYSGLPANVGPLGLHAVYRRSSVDYSSLTPAQRQVVDEQALRGRSDVLALAAALGMQL